MLKGRIIVTSEVGGTHQEVEARNSRYKQWKTFPSQEFIEEKVNELTEDLIDEDISLEEHFEHKVAHEDHNRYYTSWFQDPEKEDKYYLIDLLLKEVSPASTPKLEEGI